MSGQGDPYAGFLLEMRDQARKILPPGWVLGTVVDVGDGRLKIRAEDGQELDEEDLWVDPRLLGGHESPFQVELSSVEDTKATLDIDGTYVRTYIPIGTSAITSIPLWELPGVLSGKVTMKVTSDRLKVGDRVAMLPTADGQSYYVLTKVVRPGDIVSSD